MSVKTALYALLVLIAGCASASAQNANDLINSFGGIMRSAITQATQTEWKKLPQSERDCVDQTLRQRGSDLQTEMQKGITPSDARVADVRAACRPSTVQNNSSDASFYYVANTQPPDGFLALRTNPAATFGQRIMAMPNGTLLQVLQRQADGWWYVKVIPTGQQGWALSGQGSTVWIECCTTAAATQLPDRSRTITDSQAPETQQLLWNHNGSTVYLVAQGRSRKYFYKEPRSGLLSEGVKPGSLLFDGEVIGDQYQGTAYIFNSRCGPQPYHVSGPILDNYRRVELREQAPRVDNNCGITEYVDDNLAFQLIEPAVAAPQLTGQTALRTVSPNFDCGKAKTPREVAVCRSNELSMLDHQYGEYWAQAKPFDKKGTSKKEIVKFYRLGEACGASEDCIRANLTSGIDYLATFLKTNGVQVATYGGMQEAQRKEAEQQKAALAERQKIEAAQQQEKRRVEAEQGRLAQQQADEQRRIQRENDESRLAIVRAEAEKARAEARAVQRSIVSP